MSDEKHYYIKLSSNKDGQPVYEVWQGVNLLCTVWRVGLLKGFGLRSKVSTGYTVATAIGKAIKKNKVVKFGKKSFHIMSAAILEDAFNKHTALRFFSAFSRTFLEQIKLQKGSYTIKHNRLFAALMEARANGGDEDARTFDKVIN